MNASLSRLTGFATRYGFLAALVGFVGVFVTMVALRLVHPFELEWMEGAMVEHVQRIAGGRRIYVEPSLEFVPFIYPAAYFYLSAVIAKVTGVGFVALRLVSILSSVGVLVILYRFIDRETGDRVAAMAAVALFAGTYPLGGSFLDIGRADALYLLLLFAAFYIFRFHQSLGAHVAGGLLVALAFHTKQSALVTAAPVMLWLIFRNPRRGVVAAATAVVTTAAAMLLIDAAHDGWYRYYILEIPSGIQFFRDRLIGFWSADIVPPLLVAWLFALFYLARPGPRDTRAFHVAMATGLIASAWIPRGNPGGYVNVLIPAFLAVSVLFGLGVHAVRHAVEELPSGWRPRAELGMGLACLLQFGDLAYDPRPWLPRASDAVAGRALVRTVTAADGDVWIPYHGYISSMAGKPAYAHWMALTQVLDREADPVRASLQRQIDEALASQRYALVVGSSKPFANAPELTTHYEVAGAALHDPDALWPVAGARRRAETLYVRRREAMAVVDTTLASTPSPAASVAPPSGR